MLPVSPTGVTGNKKTSYTGFFIPQKLPDSGIDIPLKEGL